MSQVITNAFASYWQACLTDEAPVVLDAFVLANIPDLDPDLPISPDDGLPPAAQIVHRQTVDQRGRINLDAVAYTIVMDTSVGDFEFNAMYLINTEANLVGMIVHKGLETKLKTDATTGQTGNSLVKSMLMEYDRASEATVTMVDADTWQIDYAARLAGMDEDMRRLVLPLYGPAWFEGNGFLVTNNAGVYHVSPGNAAIGGLLAVQPEDEIVTPDVLPVGVWVDVYHTGSLLGAWENPASLVLSDTALADYTDSSGYQHHVAKLAIINADGTVTDLRRKHTHGHFWDEIIDPPAPEDIGALPETSYLPRPDSLRGDVPAIQNKDMDTCLPGEFGLYETSSCAHSPTGAGNWFYCETKSINADGSLIQLAWPYAGVGVLAWRNYAKNPDAWDTNWREAYDAGNKPTPADIGAAPAAHSHPWEQVTNPPATATRWPAWGEVTDKPATMPPSWHAHPAAEGNQDVIAGSWNAVGATVMARRTGAAACSPGERVAGSALLISSASASAGGALPGTWQCQGIAVANSGYVEPQVTTWIRVA
ncbi:phage tail-collar fiber domain-containing protein [Aeromonas enteropelogenes]|uniref:phage tail-collar fiber domain-containing protein n=1 Tax=Aeromonas enteropelogenes TaxID=29489 RepID=UPI003BA08499